MLAIASDEVLLTDEALASFQALLQSVLTLAAEANGVLEMDAGLADNVEFSDSVRAILSLLLSDAIELEDSATSAGLVVTVLTDLLVVTGSADTRITAQAVITAAMVLADLAAHGLSVEASSTAEFQAQVATSLRAATALLDAIVFADTAAMSLHITAIGVSETEFEDDASTVARMIANVSDSVVLAVTVRIDGVGYAAFVMNTETGSVGEYRQYPFNGLTEFAGGWYGTNETGLYNLDGDDDDGDPIPAWLRTGLTRIGTGRLKRIPDLYLALKTDGTMLVKAVTVDEEGRKEEDWYLTERVPLGDGVHNQRVKFGRGLKAAHWGYELRNVNGADFGVNDTELRPLVLDRRIS